MDKKSTREKILGLLRGQDPGLRRDRSLEIQEKLILSTFFREAKTIMSYVNTPLEVATEYLNSKVLISGKKLVVPYLDRDTKEMFVSRLEFLDDLIDGPLGIKNPKNGKKNIVPLEEIDLVVVPALAYDKNNVRLGRGGGYYDRFLSEMSCYSTTTIGLAYDFQIMDCLPIDPHDMPVSMVLTNE